MIIAISGTPGIGKTSATKVLKKTLKANVISLYALMKKKKIKSTYDKKRRTRVVTTKSVRTAVGKAIKKGVRTNIVDGHLSHFAKADIYVILRCQPDVLARRMRKKGWNKDKIIENLRAEVLDTVTIEALELHPKNKIVEIDTTYERPTGVARLIESLLNNYHRQKQYSTGKIDWSEKYAKYLLTEDTVMTA